MVSIKDFREINASQDRVWGVVSDVEKDVEYWTALSSIRNIRKEGNMIEREVVVRFMGNKSTQRITLNPMDSIQLEMISGPLRGSREIKLSRLGTKRTRIEVSWDIQFAEIPVFAQGFVRARIEEGTQEALAKIGGVAEGRRRATSRHS